MGKRDISANPPKHVPTSFISVPLALGANCRGGETNQVKNEEYRIVSRATRPQYNTRPLLFGKGRAERRPFLVAHTWVAAGRKPMLAVDRCRFYLQVSGRKRQNLLSLHLSRIIHIPMPRSWFLGEKVCGV